MIDGPLSLLLMMGVLGSALFGVVMFLLCLLATISNFWKRHAIRAFAFGFGGGILVFAITAFIFISMRLELDEFGVLIWLWGTMFSLAAFGWGAILAGIISYWRTKSKARLESLARSRV